ncbi:MAG: STAS domain-containing protein [Verrucomicrobia bacterium]|nr:STAS domain-containing protein [Verrucomicrobiota bacterium]
MNSRTMIAHTLESAAGRLNLTIPGDILSTSTEILQQEIFGVLESAPVRTASLTSLNLDLTAAKMVDSAGLNLLVAIIKWAKSHKAEVGVAISSANIQRTFAFTRLDQQIELTKV